MIGNPNIPDPVGHGWRMEKDGGDEDLSIDWMSGSPAPEAVLQLYSDIICCYIGQRTFLI